MADQSTKEGAKIKRKNIHWSRAEIILALDLYFKIPHNKMDDLNPEVIKLSKFLERRSPGAVAMKLGNLKYVDPEESGGLPNTSNLDYEVFDEYVNNKEALFHQADIIREEMQDPKQDEEIDIEDIIDKMPPGKDRKQLIKAREGQYAFRSKVLESYSNACCVTGLMQPELLVASHIKPWKDSNEKERTDPCNGLCLNSFHDAAFDKGLITIDLNYRIKISEKIKRTKMDDELKSWFLSYEKKMIKLPHKYIPKKEYIEYHNDVIFQG